MEPNPKYHVTEGTNARITCRINAYPENITRLHWYYNGNPIKSLASPSLAEHLEFENVQRNIAGEYKCRAEHVLGTGEGAAMLDVQCKGFVCLLGFYVGLPSVYLHICNIRFA